MNETISVLQKQEMKLRQRLSTLQLDKKKDKKEEKSIQKDMDLVVSQLASAIALSKIKVGARVGAVHRGETEGVVYGFQSIRDRVVGVWVVWDGSKVPLPEEAVALIVK